MAENTCRKLLHSRKSLLAFLLVIAMMLPYFVMPAAAAPMSNSTLQDALDALNPSASTPIINLSGREDIYGEIDLAEIIADFPDLEKLDISSTNVTNVANSSATNAAGATVVLVKNDTFANNDRSFIVNSAAITVRESAVNPVAVSDFTDKILIKRANGTTTAAPAGMIVPGATASIVVGANATAVVTGSETVPHADFMALPTGAATATLSGFEVAETGTTPLAVQVAGADPTVNLQIRKAGYELSPPNPIVMDGGTVELTFTQKDENGTVIAIGSASDYTVVLTPAGTGTPTTLTASVVGGALKIKVASSSLVNASGASVGTATLDISRVSDGTLCVSTTITKQPNPGLSALELQEYASTAGTWGFNGTVNSGDMIHVAGGTATSSKTPALIATYDNATTYLLRGSGVIPGLKKYLSTNYAQQIDIAIGNDPVSGDPWPLQADLVEVDDPTAPGTKILGLQVTATTGAQTLCKDTITSPVPPATAPPPAIELTLTNSGGVIETIAFDVTIQANAPTGYKFFVINEMWNGLNKFAFEELVKDGDDRVQEAAHFELDTSGAYTLVGTENLAKILEGTKSLLVPMAYYGTDDTQLSVLPGQMIQDWLDDDATPKVLPKASTLATATPLAASDINALVLDGTTAVFGTHAVELDTANLVTPASAGDKDVIRFVGKSSANQVPINLEVVAPEVTDYLIVENGNIGGAGIIVGSGSTSVYDQLQTEIDAVATATPGSPATTSSLYDLNIGGTDAIAIGSSKNYAVVAIFNNYTSAYVDLDALTAPNGIVVDANGRIENDTTTTPPSTTGDFTIKVLPGGGPKNSTAGGTATFKFTDGTLSSKEIVLTLDAAKIDEVYLVFEDYNENLFSPDLALNTRNDIKPMPTGGFEIPEGTDIKVYPVYGFRNNPEYYDDSVNWEDGIIDTADAAIAITKNSSSLATTPVVTTAGSYTIDAGDMGTLLTPWNTTTDTLEVEVDGTGLGASGTVTLHGNTYDLTGLSKTPTYGDFVNVEPIVASVLTKADTNATAATTIDSSTTPAYTVNGRAGDWLVTNPEVVLTNGTVPVSIIGLTGTDTLPTSGNDYLGNVTTEINAGGNTTAFREAIDEASVAPVPYTYGLYEHLATNVKISYTYEYTLNGEAQSLTLEETGGTAAYEFEVEIDKPEVEEILLFAESPTLTTVYQGAPPMTGSVVNGDTLFTLPYEAGSKLRVYPVIIDSRYKLEQDDIAGGLTPANPISGTQASSNMTLGSPSGPPTFLGIFDPSNIAGKSYINYATNADFDVAALENKTPLTTTSTKTTTLTNPGGAVTQGPILNDGSKFYYELGIIGLIDDSAPAKLEVDLASFKGGASDSTNYDGYAVAFGPAEISFYNMDDATTAKVVDVVISNPRKIGGATVLTNPAGEYILENGEGLDARIQYRLSTTASGASGALVDPTYFGTDVLPTLGGGTWSNPVADESGNANVLRIEVVNAPTGSAMKGTDLTAGYATTDTSGVSRLQITPDVPGSYEFKLWTVNNAGVVAPNSPTVQEQIIKVLLQPTTVGVDIGYGETMSIASIPGIGTLPAGVTFSQTGTDLDATELNQGVIKMANNTAGNTTVSVKNSSGVVVAQVNVRRNATTLTPVLIPAGTVTSPYAMQNGQSTMLQWSVSASYTTASSTTVSYTFTENVDAGSNTIIQTHIDAGITAAISSSILTTTGTGVGTIVYSATYAETNTKRSFWVDYDGSTTVTYDYGISSSNTTYTAEASINEVMGSTLATHYLWKDVSATASLETITLANSDNTAVATVSFTGNAFTVNAIAVGTANITIYPSSGGSITIPVTVTAAPILTYAVSGNVTDATTGAPIPGVTVSVSGMSITATTDTLGDYTLSNVPAGTHTLTFTAAGYVANMLGVAVTTAAVTGQDIALTPAPAGTTYTISGTVKDAGGTGIVGANVAVIDAATGTAVAGSPAVTTAGGAYTITVADGATYTLTASASGYNTSAATSVPVSGANVTQDFTLTPAPAGTTYTISGTVKDAGGTGIVGANVAVIDAATGTAVAGSPAVTTSGGAYTITVADGATYTLTVSASGYNTSAATSVPVSGANVTKDFTLTVRSSTGTTGTPSTKYDVTVDAGKGGSASASLKTAAKNAEVKVTVTPDKDYVVDSVIVTDKNNKTVTVTEGKNGTYTFKMPASDVTVKVTFKTENTDEHTDCPSKNFKDVDQTQWYHEYIDYVLLHKVMNGTSNTTFEPQTKVSRGMMVQILYNLEGKPASTKSASFTDVGENDWFAAAVAWAAENEIVTGYDENTFGPNDNVTREQMAAIVYRYSNFKKYDTQKSDALSAFVDAGEVGDWATAAVKWAVGAELINGRDATHLAPSEASTRAEIATIMTRYCQSYKLF